MSDLLQKNLGVFNHGHELKNETLRTGYTQSSFRRELYACLDALFGEDECGFPAVLFD